MATFTTGYVGFQVFGADADTAPDLEPPRALREVLVRVWPSQTDFHWPPASHIGLDALDLIAEWPARVFPRAETLSDVG